MLKICLYIICFSWVGFALSQNITDSKGKKQGEWYKLHPNSKVYVYKGQFKDDKPVGTFTYYYPSSKVKAIVKHNDKSNRSEAFFYHETGKLMSYGFYKNAKKDSVWMNFGPSGKISNTETYKNDSLDGKKTIFYVPEITTDQSKIVSAVHYFSNGKPHGEWIEYFNDKTIKSKGTYTDGKKTGVWESYHTTGAKMTMERYKSGVLHGWCYAFDATGKQIGKVYYYQGKRLQGKVLEARLANLKKLGIDPND
jgi:antitoxin component YwqK of YwqJK toxin-antitoxin module